MTLGFQRAVDRYAGVPICALLSGVAWIRAMASGAAPAREPRRILVILLSEMGSLVLAQPMFAEIRRRYPRAALHALVFEKNREVLDLLGVMPPESVLTIDDRTFAGLTRTTLGAIRGLRALGIDVVIDCELFSRLSSILSYVSGAAVRVGFERHTQEGLYRGSFINRRVLYNPYRHLSSQFLTMVEAIASVTVPLDKQVPASLPPPPPPVSFSTAELEGVRATLNRDFPATAGQRLVLVSPGGGTLPIRAWPAAHFVRLCRGLIEDGCAVGIIGLASDAGVARAIASACASDRCIDLTGYTKTVRHLLALFQHAALLVANDGGPGQFAALTPIPSLVLFGPETPALYGSLAPNSAALFLGLPCSPCLTAYNHRASPCDGDNQCLKQIAPETVLARARAILGAAR
jgi:ADP-heptose:LPS heptosyltransferase